MNTKIIKQIGIPALALGIIFALGACSSKPSPWSQSASPWDGRDSSQPEPLAVEDIAAAEDPSPFVNDAVMTEPAAIEEPSSLEDGAAFEVPPDTMAEEPMMEEAMPVEAEAIAEPAMKGAVEGGDINAQPAGYYALQVVASSNMGNLKAFAERNQFSDQWVAETTVDGKTWFVLLQGIYPTMDEAKSVLEQVGASLDTSPWVRSVGSLQAVMVQ